MGALEGRVAIITGAGNGLGREHAHLFAKEGAKVVVNDVGAVGDGSGDEISAAELVAEEIRAAGGDAVASTESVTSWDAARRIVSTAVESFGDLHVVVNNAGILRDRTLVSMTEDEFDAVVDVHLKGTFAVTRWAGSYWRDQTKAGSTASRAVVNTSSGAGLHGNPGQTNYAAAKAGIAAMTLVWGRELARYGVSTNCIAPIARTRLTLATPGVGDVVQGALFDPENISPLVVALAAEDCPFNGQVFSVYGGSVGIYSGWSIAQEVTRPDRWPVADLIEALADLPRHVKVDSQMARIAAMVR
jgi:NAD(P)-dependent dehydrogenase (short-subunit alcohol dehydrogenase family)